MRHILQGDITLKRGTMNPEEILTLIRNRRSIRKFQDRPVPDAIVNDILEAARWSPSGLNNQPWRFVIIKNNSRKNSLAECTRYRKVIESANQCVAVYYNLPTGYNRDKDILGIGACVQNMLLMAEAHGIGAVWLGEILNRKKKVNEVLGLTDENELLAVIAFGYPDEKPAKDRKALDTLILNRT